MNPDAFPYQFECVDCPDGRRNTTTVTYEEAVDELPPHVNEHDATVRGAVDNAMANRGWHEVKGRRMCPECVSRHWD
jgi:hypothetical protein